MKSWIVHNAPRPFLRLYRKIRLLTYSCLNLPRVVRVPLMNGREVVMETRDWATANFCKNHVDGDVLRYEPRETELFQQKAGHAQVFFDIGAQIGYYSLIAAGLGVKRVYAFEPNDHYAAYGRKHAVRNGLSKQITFVRLPVGKEGERVEFEDYNAHIRKSAVSLDGFCTKHNVWPDVLKIDVEGFELDVLQGGELCLKRHPVIFLALHPPFIRKRGKDPAEVFREMTKFGYRCVSLSGRGEKASEDFDDYICSPGDLKVA